MSIHLASDLAYQFLPSGDCVVYSPQGSAQPFVLGGKALEIFYQVRGRELIDLTNCETVAILDYFSQEKMILGHNTISASIPAIPLPERRRKTFSFWVHSTDVCNLDCDYCYVKKGRLMLSRSVADALIDRIVRDNGLLRVEEIHFKFAGGEPLIGLSTILYMLEQAKT